MGAWRSPLPYRLMATDEPESFRSMPQMTTGIPVAEHPGAFGVRRKFHWHEGVDMYVPAGTPVSTVEPGVVVGVVPFTGVHAGAEFSHWLDTWAVLVEGPSGVVVYGEVAPHVRVGKQVVCNELLGVVINVLKKDKGRPRSMLHLELHTHGARKAPEWTERMGRPATLLDPTEFLLSCIGER